MLARVSRGKEGMAEYLITGHRSDDHHSRKEKDHVIPVFGDIDVFQKAEDYLLKNKNYKDSYTHITVAFSKRDMSKLEGLEGAEKNKAYQDITERYIKHHTSGYDLKHEVIAYAEVHEPKVKKFKGKDRLRSEESRVGKER